MGLFKRKRQDTPKQSVSNENRRAPRYGSWAHVRINGFEGEAILRNINLGGFCLESRTFAAITVRDRYTMNIVPEVSTALNPFGLEVEVRWVRSTESRFSAGFAVTKLPSDRGLEKYVEYLRTHVANVS
ncbi:MAG: PilZ domain-containing protein [Spirochaetaceae bacterium]|jgi:hypothetical protein|nr:PilZ domain-containing protein [Spirochaetaceae bacterium]